MKETDNQPTKGDIMGQAGRMPTYDELRAEVQASSACSFWLKDALAKSEHRDCVDSLYDAKTLVFILQTKVNELTKQAG